jgi:hypothetical protein
MVHVRDEHHLADADSRRPQHLNPTFGCAVIGTPACSRGYRCAGTERNSMNGLIYLIGLIVVIMAILSFLGLR